MEIRAVIENILFFLELSTFFFKWGWDFIAWIKLFVGGMGLPRSSLDKPVSIIVREFIGMFKSHCRVCCIQFQKFKIEVI